MSRSSTGSSSRRRRTERRWFEATPRAMPNSQLFKVERPSNSTSRRCTTMKTSCAASSIAPGETPSARRLRQTKENSAR
jgi:hypothetical protein